MGVRGGLGLPGGGFEEWRTRAWPFACARALLGGAWRGSAPEARTGEDAQLASPTEMWLRRQPHVPVVTLGCSLHHDPEADPEAGGHHTWPPWLAPPRPRTITF